MSNDPVTANNGMVGYTYDAVGNRQQRTSSITAIPMQNFTGQYDPDDRLTAGYTYDGDGSTLTDPTGKTYTYDSLDRLVSVTGTGLNENFVYDGDGNKVSQTVNSVTINYLIDSNNLTGYAQVLEEMQGSGVNAVYSYGTSRIGEDLFNGTSWTLSFYGYDGQGSVRYLTNGAGSITDTYDYDSFGNLINQTHVGTPTPNEFFFDGEQLDGNTGFYNLRARWMNPGTGRFQTMDSFEGDQEDPLSVHKYLFVGDDTVNQIDPSGHGIDNEPKIYWQPLVLDSDFLFPLPKDIDSQRLVAITYGESGHKPELTAEKVAIMAVINNRIYQNKQWVLKSPVSAGSGRPTDVISVIKHGASPSNSSYFNPDAWGAIMANDDTARSYDEINQKIRKSVDRHHFNDTVRAALIISGTALPYGNNWYRVPELNNRPPLFWLGIYAAPSASFVEDLPPSPLGSSYFQGNKNDKIH